MSGTLYLLPTTLALREDPVPLHTVLPTTAIEVARRIDYVIAENAKTARAFLKHAAPERVMQSIEIRTHDRTASVETLDALLDPIVAGRDAALVSEAGCPAIADPGSDLVARAHVRAVRVRPLVGPSSILLAWMASGLDGQRFAFHGYLPTDASQRVQAIRTLEERSRRESQTQACIETPYRNPALWTALVTTLAPETRLCVAIDLTLPDERIVTRRVDAWRADTDAAARLHKRAAIFLFLAARA